jgi:hypothetical protein
MGSTISNSQSFATGSALKACGVSSLAGDLSISHSRNFSTTGPRGSLGVREGGRSAFYNVSLDSSCSCVRLFRVLLRESWKDELANS